MVLDKTWLEQIELLLETPIDNEEAHAKKENYLRLLGAVIERASQYDPLNALEIFDALSIAARKLRRDKRKLSEYEVSSRSYDLSILAMRTHSHLVKEVHSAK